MATRRNAERKDRVQRMEPANAEQAGKGVMLLTYQRALLEEHGIVARQTDSG